MSNKMNYPFVLCHPADKGGCAYYRIIWPGTALIGSGYMNGLMSDRLLTRHEAQVCRPDVVITQRQYYDFQLETLDDYKKAGTFIIYELDDILTRVPEWSPHFKDFPKDIKQRLQRAFGSVNKIVTSTPKLKEQLLQLSGRTPVQVLPNYLPPIWKTLEPYRPDNKKFRIGWAGALAHEMDLEILKPVMSYFKDSVQWVFMGLTPTNMPEGCDVEKVSGVPLEIYAQSVQKLNLNLAVVPLEHNMLNRCKSGIRVMELGIFGCPVITTDLEPYRPFKSITRVPNETDKWVAAIEEHLANPDRCIERGRAVREEVINNHMLMDHLPEVMDAWNLTDKTPAFIPKGIQDKSKPEEHPFTVVVSTHSAPELTKNCIESLIEAKQANKTPYEIVVLTGNVHPEVIKAVEPLKEKVNKFIPRMSVNEMIATHPGHIIWTRGNTVVYGDWLDRIKKVMDETPDGASYSPFMNENTLPHVALNNENSPATMFPDKDGWGADFIAAQSKSEVGVPAPLPGRNFVVFRKEMLDNCGYFDEDSYPLGYRMVDDWSIIAGFHGFKHYIVPSVFVSVFGEPSYDKIQELQKNSSHRLVLRYPMFFQSYKGQDSAILSGYKANLELLCAKSGRPSVVVVTGPHTMETDVYLHTLGNKLDLENVDLFLMRPNSDNTVSFEKRAAPFHFLGKPPVLNGIGLKTIEHILGALNCKAIDVHTLTSYHHTMANFLMRVADDNKIPIDITMQDMQWWCPQIHMLWKTPQQETVDTFCDRSSVSTCRECVKMGTPFGFIRMEDWTSRYSELLAKCRHIYLPSDTCERYASRYMGSFSHKFKKIQLNDSIQFVPTQGNKVLIMRTPASMREVELYKEVISTVVEAKFLYIGQGYPFGQFPNLGYLQQPLQNLQQLDQFLMSEKPTYYLDLSKYPKMFDSLGIWALSKGITPIVIGEGPMQETIDQQKELVGEFISSTGSPIAVSGIVNEVLHDSIMESALIEFGKCSKISELYETLDTGK